ncbi:hypothetical protein AMTR_s00011p00212380 [Amborella trichopoda]|uniref:Uncharacterized protein n=1 Tax=Amborella trichopoda TaxID=13333 RepID=W1NHM9_AMBTC|nr:hypothetical protein AMTR_s00011p00212380 [Amborella trichopoda]
MDNPPGPKAGPMAHLPGESLIGSGSGSEFESIASPILPCLMQKPNSLTVHIVFLSPLCKAQPPAGISLLLFSLYTKWAWHNYQLFMPPFKKSIFLFHPGARFPLKAPCKDDPKRNESRGSGLNPETS